MSNFPAGVTVRDIDRHFGGPDEPVHEQTRCPNCHLFIRRSGWECEDDGDEEGPFLSWFVRCRSCWTVVVES